MLGKLPVPGCPTYLDILVSFSLSLGDRPVEYHYENGTTIKREYIHLYILV